MFNHLHAKANSIFPPVCYFCECWKARKKEPLEQNVKPQYYLGANTTSGTFMHFGG